jgi:hypothetical protein
MCPNKDTTCKLSHPQRTRGGQNTQNASTSSQHQEQNNAKNNPKTSCSPSCKVPGCQNDHGPVCPNGGMCQVRETCKLYHPIRQRAALHSTSAEFHPPDSTTTTNTKPSSPHQAQMSYSKAAESAAPTLSVAAVPFKPNAPQSSAAQPENNNNNNNNGKKNGNDINPDNSTTQTLRAEATSFKPTRKQDNNNNNQQQHQQQQQSSEQIQLPFSHHPIGCECQDCYDYYDDEYDEDDEFALLVDSIAADPRYSSWSEQEIEALANERFFESRAFDGRSTSNILNNIEIVQYQNVNYNCQCCQDSPNSCEGSTMCLSRGVCVCVDDEVDHAKLDTWVASSRLCQCCKGFIYKCSKKAPNCAKGECDCKTVQQTA